PRQHPCVAGEVALGTAPDLAVEGAQHEGGAGDEGGVVVAPRQRGPGPGGDGQPVGLQRCVRRQRYVGGVGSVHGPALPTAGPCGPSAGYSEASSAAAASSSTREYDSSRQRPSKPRRSVAS